ncbi:neutral/alkaline ceramidase [Mangrovihabitans endophyticus]|uniref:Neutral ceramidase n=1 Tax=Mangrovihabitans endophyticus TaxID=1751298 RepID=A0A8J3C4C3_9ACTN|nr:neutral/alkaline ceramidase [Mangrovihabitans endophyticus]GGL07673.1 neutral ceramidase [Mangrovihabitans endophyticus]
MSLRTRLLAVSSAVLLLVTALTGGPAPAAPPGGYLVGVGIGDITGEAAEVGMLGYADPGQTTAGLASRQWARAFVVADAAGRHVAFVSTEIDFVSQAVQQEVLRRLAAEHGDVYGDANVVITATHTHSGPGGFSEYTLWNLTTFGFEAPVFEAIVSGIVRAIDAADASLAPGTVKIAEGTLRGANVNRSLPAFRADPPADQARFPDAVDTRMTVLRFEQGGTGVGMIDFFPTHGTSMTPSNHLISADNKGYAAHLIEDGVHGVDWAHRGAFVAAFAQTNAGDMSPNLRDGGALGPTDDEFENTRIIGQRQADKAQELYASATEELTGPIDFRGRYVDFSDVEVSGAYTPDGQPHHTCPGALGQNFTAGAEDGPGPPIVDEGDMRTNPLLLLAGIVVNPTPPDVRACQAPKQVFLGTGSQHPPWTPQVMPLQVLRIGQLAVTTAPGEFTIVAGQRVRDAVDAELSGVTTHQILAGYANTYAGYVATPEEYDLQHYEGAATHFGRYTGPAYEQELAKLAAALRDGRTTPSTVRPPALPQNRISARPGVVLDTPPLGKSFGSVLVQPGAAYGRGATVRVDFVTGHPNNNLRDEGTFVEIQRQAGGQWHTVVTDSEWQTTYRWEREYLSVSTAHITWTVPADTPAGTYRVVHHGDAKNLLGVITPFTGASRAFTVG